MLILQVDNHKSHRKCSFLGMAWRMDAVLSISALVDD